MQALATRVGYRLPIHYFAVSTWLASVTSLRNCQIVANGVNTAVFREVPRVDRRPRLVVGAIGRPGWVKGHDTFLQALALLRPEFADCVTILLASPGDSLLPTPPGYEVATVSPSTDAEMADFYHSLDIFSYTSRQEGFGMPPLEAMACGIPVVMTDSGGPREYASGSNAMIVPAGSASHLGAALRKLISSDELRSQLGKAGLKTAQMFSETAAAKRYIAAFESLERGTAPLPRASPDAHR
jgi:glycosyltransferase involved in cell wall biosynthesis